MAKIQDTIDERQIPLPRVGITDLVHPASLRDRDGNLQTTEATLGLFVDLVKEARAAHMSRFVEVLAGKPILLSPENIEGVLGALREALGAGSAHLIAECTFFYEKQAPVSEAVSLLACPTTFEASLEDAFDLVLTVEVPVMTVCPCSKEATGGPAHSQRGHVAVSVRYRGRLAIEEIVEVVERSGSSAVYPLLKGDDERTLINSAYENPVFVEDLVRNVAERLDSDVRITWYRVEAVNLDSVHDHNLYACAERSH